MKAIETQYKGYRFRSRLEARWAVFFDALQIEWRYEPEGFELSDGTRYLPDFWLPQVNMWAEVKGQDFTEAETSKCRLLASESGCPCIMLNGMPDGRNFWAIEPTGDLVDYVPGQTKGYWLTEGRFYACSGNPFPRQDTSESVDPSAIHAARSARFEHGESGAWQR